MNHTVLTDGLTASVKPISFFFSNKDVKRKLLFDLSSTELLDRSYD